MIAYNDWAQSPARANNVLYFTGILQTTTAVVVTIRHHALARDALFVFCCMWVVAMLQLWCAIGQLCRYYLQTSPLVDFG